MAELNPKHGEVWSIKSRFNGAVCHYLIKRSWDDGPLQAYHLGISEKDIGNVESPTSRNSLAQMLSMDEPRRVATTLKAFINKRASEIRKERHEADNAFRKRVRTILGELEND